MNKYQVTIHGKTYTLAGEETKEHTEKLAHIVDVRISDIMSKFSSLSVTDAAVLTALDCMDELFKTNQNIENIRSQIKDYMDDASRARNQAAAAQREVRTLTEKVAMLEKELSERTNFKPSEIDEKPVSAEDILSQDIREAIDKPVNSVPKADPSANFVGTVNYDPNLSDRKFGSKNAE